MAAPMANSKIKIMLGFKSHQKMRSLTKTVDMIIRNISIRNGKMSKPKIMEEPETPVGEFRVLDLNRNVEDPTKRFGPTRRRKVRPIPPPRSLKMKTDQDWTSVWPAASTFKWSVVPLPIRQGAIKRKSEAKGDGLAPDKYANTELIKIPNFLHLTPNHIRQHCQAIRKYCTSWPEMLGDEEIKSSFPIEVITSDYCFSAPSVRDERARTVTIKFKLDALGLDYHGRDKFRRLVGPDRYNPVTGEVTLTADRCPIKKQNYDYLQYVLTALYFESWNVEPWEAEKTEEDMECYFWDISHSKKNIVQLLNKFRNMEQENQVPEEGRQFSDLPTELTEETVTSLESVMNYKKAVEDIHNAEENISNINNYKESVMRLLKIQPGLKSLP